MNKKKLGSIIDHTTGEPLSYALFRITSGADHETVIRSGVADVRGRYYAIVPKGTCYVDIEKKNADGSYTKVYESGLMNVQKGLINLDIKI